MEHFLTILLSLSLLGSLLAGILILLRFFLQKCVSRAAFYYLWLLVLLRLCIPVGVTIPLPAAFGEPDAPAVLSPADNPGTPPSLIDTENEPVIALPIPAPALPSIGPVMPDISAQTRLQNWSALPSALWILGTAMCLGWYAWSYLRFSKRIKGSCIPPSSQALAVLRELAPAGRIGLAECPLASTPMLMGVVHPVIVLPVGIEGRERLEDLGPRTDPCPPA